MSYSTHLALLLPTLLAPDHDSDQPQPQQTDLEPLLDDSLRHLRQLIDLFRHRPASPDGALRFERQLQGLLRELGRQATQWAYNHLEPHDVADLPKHARCHGGAYTRLNRKTPQNAWTLFGQVRLWRVGYRPTDKGPEPTLFPLALALGLVHGASPALAGHAARLLACAGMTQSQVLRRLKQDQGVGWGVQKLRQVTAAVSQALGPVRQDAQVEQLLGWLTQAAASKGRHKPVLSVGRDGITLPLRCKGGRIYEVASTATVSVLGRRGKRLGTVYLAYVPESGQPTMSRQLTALVRAVLLRWPGTLPRLCYVSDGGDNETSYYRRVLVRMKHPRTGERLNWIRVVDYYHASARVWALAELLFGNSQRGHSWARKMQRWLKKPGGVNRVLHSAAAHRERVALAGKKLKEFGKAYGYLRQRMRHMRYAEYGRLGVPLGSGVTEAACKTIYTQRLKLSGMRWHREGAQVVLDLRVVELSGVWDQAYEAALKRYPQAKIRGQAI